MGFLSKLFGTGGAPPPPGGGPGPNFGLRPDRDGPLLNEEDATRGTFPRKMKVRPVQVDYGLKGRWDVVSLDSPTSWATVREQLLGEFYQRFGLIKLGDGTKTIRWNEQTWRAVREMMAFEYDPQYAVAGPSNG